MVASIDGIEAAVITLVRTVRAEACSTQMSVRDVWAMVRGAIEQAAPAAARSDLYSPDGNLNEQNLLHISGLRAAAPRSDISEEAIAAEFAAFCARPVPDSEDWILLDARMPPGLSVPIGDYTLETHSYDELLALHPLPCLTAADGDASLMPPALDGAAFLQQTRADSAGSAGWRYFMNDVLGSTLIEHENWVPLLALALWSPSITRAEAIYEVERGRYVFLGIGKPVLFPEEVDLPDGTVGEHLVHDTEGMYLSAAEVPAFTAFTATVVERVERVMAGLEGSKGRKKLARRLQAASSHLLRAAHRTRGRDGHYIVSAYEVNEVLLHYVIAMEALLADDSDHLDLSRKVEYRAATLFDSDDERIRVGKLVKSAYQARSKYVHGDEVDPDLDLDALRETARQVLLRWLILASSGEDGPVESSQVVPSLLDRATLSDQARREFALGPLREFFTATPTAAVPASSGTQGSAAGEWQV